MTRYLLYNADGHWFDSHLRSMPVNVVPAGLGGWGGVGGDEYTMYITHPCYEPNC